MDHGILSQTKEGNEAVLGDPPVGDLRPSDRRVHHGWSWQRSNFKVEPILVLNRAPSACQQHCTLSMIDLNRCKRFFESKVQPMRERLDMQTAPAKEMNSLMIKGSSK